MSAPQAPPSDAISVVIIDDHLLVADAVSSALQAAGDIVVRAIAATCGEGLVAIREQQPDVCLLDQRLPDGLGTDLLPALVEASPRTRILLVTGSDTDDVLRRALAGGCVGFLAKGQRAATLVDAVHRAAEGETVVSADDLRRLMPGPSRGGMRLGDDLTAREREILNLLVQGLATPTISSQLFISPATVRNHIQSILSKLSAHSKLEAVAIAVHEGIVERA